MKAMGQRTDKQLQAPYATSAVSVIVPIYNGQKYLQRCLNSLYEQTLQPIQIICVNDGSTDGSAEILSENLRRHPDILVLTQANKGLSSARNAGLEIASGEYIDFLDCDDMLQPCALEKLYARAIDQQLDMLLFDGESVFENAALSEALSRYKDLYRTKIRLRNAVSSGEKLFVQLMEGNSYRSSACLYLIRRSFLQSLDLRFSPGLLYEDNAFTLQCLLQANRAAVDATPYYLRSVHTESIITMRKDYLHAKSYYLAQHQIQQFLLIKPVCEDTMRCAYQLIASLQQHAATVYHMLSPKEIQAAERCDPIAVLLRILAQGSAMPVLPSSVPPKSVCSLRSFTPPWPSDTFLYDLCQIPFRSGAPFVSVVIYVYNASSYLRDIIHDLRTQPLRNVELLFVDDGSADESYLILKQAQEEDERIRVLQQPHGYAGTARNNGMAQANGEYLLFLNATDQFQPELLSHAYACASIQQADIVLWHGDLLNMQKDKLSSPAFLTPCERLPDHVFTAREGKLHLFDTLHPSTKLYRRTYIRSLGIEYQALCSSNDVFFSMVALACAQRIAPLPEVLLHYRGDQSNHTHPQKDQSPLDVFTAFSAVKHELERRELFEEFRKPFAAKACESVIFALDTMHTLKGYQILYNALHSGGVVTLDIARLSEEDILHIPNGSLILRQCRQIAEQTFDEHILSLLANKDTAIQSLESALYHENSMLRKEIYELRHSYSYQIGNKLIALPRKLRHWYQKFKLTGKDRHHG